MVHSLLRATQSMVWQVKGIMNFSISIIRGNLNNFRVRLNSIIATTIENYALLPINVNKASLQTLISCKVACWCYFNGIIRDNMKLILAFGRIPLHCLLVIPKRRVSRCYYLRGLYVVVSYLAWKEKSKTKLSFWWMIVTFSFGRLSEYVNRCKCRSVGIMLNCEL